MFCWVRVRFLRKKIGGWMGNGEDGFGFGKTVYGRWAVAGGDICFFLSPVYCTQMFSNYKFSFSNIILTTSRQR